MEIGDTVTFDMSNSVEIGVITDIDYQNVKVHIRWNDGRERMYTRYDNLSGLMRVSRYGYSDFQERIKDRMS